MKFRKLALILCIYFLFFFIFITPGQYSQYKFICILLTYILIKKNGFYNNSISNLIIFIVILIGLFSFIHGVLNGFYIGAIDELRTYLLWPFFYFLIFSTIYDKEHLLILNQIFFMFVNILPFIILSLFIIIYIGIIDNLYIPLTDVPYFLLAFDEGRTDLFILNINFLIFSSFLVVSKFFISLQHLNIQSIFLNSLVLLAYFILMILAGRKAWYLCFFIVCIALLFFEFKKISLRLLSLLLISFGLISFSIMNILDINLLSIFNDIAYGFDNESGGMERYEQFQALSKLIQQSPVFGYGLGSFSIDSIRNIEAPWHYELTYLKVVLNVGMVGLFIYFVIIIYYFVNLYKLNKYIVFYLYALFGYMLLAFTNPYLANFDMLWTIFILIHFNNKYKIR